MLHKKVAKLNRETEYLLYVPLLSKGVVGLDENKFMAAKTNDNIEMVVEEGCVLLLERVIIPAIDQHGRYEPDDFDQDAKRMLAHFATNLCGQGYYFLRKWVIDHMHLVLPRVLSKKQQLIRLACTLLRVDPELMKPKNPALYQGLDAEALRLYKQLAEIFKTDCLDGSKSEKVWKNGRWCFPPHGCCERLWLSGPKTGTGLDSRCREYVLHIKKVGEIITMQQIYLENGEKKTTHDQGFANMIHETSVPEKIPLEDLEIRYMSYYNSTVQCHSEKADWVREKLPAPEIEPELQPSIVLPHTQPCVEYILNAYGRLDNCSWARRSPAH